MKPSDVDLSSKKDKGATKELKNDIKDAKKKLVKKASRKDGLWENFGQKELRKLEDKDYGFSPRKVMKKNKLLDSFDDWLSTFDLGKLRRYKKTKNLEKIL